MAWERALLLLLLLLTASVGALRTIYLQPGDGQGFAEAVAEYGSSGEDTILYLPRGQLFSLRNATIVDAAPDPSGAKPFSSGTLTIMPAPGDSTRPTVLDAGMLSAMARVGGGPAAFANTAELHVNDLYVINMCETVMRFPSPTKTLVGYTASQFGLFTRLASLRSQFFTNVVQYIRQVDLAQNQYWTIITQAPFPAFTTLLQIINPYPSASYYAPRALSTYEGITSTFAQSAALYTNSSLRSLDDPSDPFLSELRRSGVLMSPRLCGNTTSDAQLPMSWDPGAPIVLASDTKMWVEGVRRAAEVAGSSEYAGGLVPVVMLLTAAQPAAYITFKPLPTLNGMLLLAGVFSDTPDVYGWQAILDFSGQALPVLPIVPSGQLYILWMTLQKLPTAPLPKSGASSVFPLSVFPRAPSSALIGMDRVTLRVSDIDFLALLTLAQPDLSRCLNNMTVQLHAAALSADIAALQSVSVSTGYAALQLGLFTGWGLNATNLKITPSSPDVLAGIGAVCNAQVQTQGGPVYAWQSLMLGVVLSFIGGVAVCGAVLAVWSLRQRRPRIAMVQSASSGNSSCDEFDHQSPVIKVQPDTAPQQTKPASTATNSVVSVGPQPFQGLCAEAVQPDSHPQASRVTLLSALHAASHPSLARLVSQPLATHTADQSVHGGAAGRALESDDVKQLQSFCAEASLVPGAAQQQGAGDKVLLLLAGREPAAAQAERTDSASVRGDHVSAPVCSGDNAKRTVVNQVHGGSGNAACGAPVTVCGRSVSDRQSSDPRTAVSQLVREMTPASQMVEVTGVLGQGSWGTVYGAMWKGMQVAMKTLVFEVTEDASVPGRDGSCGSGPHDQAIVEAAVAASVDHPNVVRTYRYDIQPIETHKADTQTGLAIDDATGTQEGPRVQAYKMFLIQELCNASLDSVLKSGVLHQGPGKTAHDVGSILLLLIDIAKGIEYLHSCNIVHGDLKPENVLLQHIHTGIGVICKVADFGLSARLSGDATHVSNYSKGTPFYVAPEVLVERRTSTKADVFSFGILMWQVFMGVPPYAPSLSGQPRWHEAFPFFPAHSAPPPAYLQLMHGCLLRDPKSRPSADFLVTALASILRAMEALATCHLPAEHQ